MSPASDYRPSPGTAMLVASCDGKVHCWTKFPPARKNGVHVRYAGALLKLQMISGLGMIRHLDSTKCLSESISSSVMVECTNSISYRIKGLLRGEDEHG